MASGVEGSDKRRSSWRNAKFKVIFIVTGCVRRQELFYQLFWCEYIYKLVGLSFSFSVLWTKHCIIGWDDAAGTLQRGFHYAKYNNYEFIKIWKLINIITSGRLLDTNSVFRESCQQTEPDLIWMIWYHRHPVAGVECSWFAMKLAESADRRLRHALRFIQQVCIFFCISCLRLHQAY